MKCYANARAIRGMLFHDLAVRRSPRQVLSAIDRKRNPGHVFSLRKIDYGRRYIVGPRPMLKEQALGLRAELSVGLTRTRQGWSGGDRIDPDPRRQRLRQRGRGCMQRGLAQSIGEKAWCWPEDALVNDIDNGGIKPCRRLRGKCLKKEQRRRKIHSDRPLEAGGR